ncbi:hypothetical protein PZH43_15590 [Streptococcus gordonii]|nr:hypothetical protein [Streptococcus gordonii]MDE8688528.1 hypothetical protein [Streptococcus gordonii]
MDNLKKDNWINDRKYSRPITL